ncbi:MAG TPA: hypothetical protein PKE45_00600 [Caldilineaceae bacterium]|mgnify:CR=1 FL=1|nr:hypothetical protein [Caldilineaceae bacterium]
MLYLLGGAARSGKSTVAHQFLAQTGTPFFCLDYLMMGVTHGATQLGVNPDEPDLHTAAKLAPLIRAMAVAMIENGERYLLEGVQLQPRLVADLCSQHPGQVLGCFLGYAEIDTRTKVHQIRTLDGGNNDWLSEYDDQQLYEMVDGLKQVSATLRNECQRYGLRYFETSTNHTATLDAVVAFLKASASLSAEA